MTENFYKAFELLLSLEGYRSDVHGDPGGRTIFGVTEKWYPEHIKAMETMTPDQARIYARDVVYKPLYWDKLNCDTLAYPLDIIAFCQGVNALNVARKILNETSDWKDFLFKFLSYYSRLCAEKPDLIKFLRGWLNRCVTLWLKFKEIG
jgi:histone deacetylase complex regulatory component SIN3